MCFIRLLRRRRMSAFESFQAMAFSMDLKRAKAGDVNAQIMVGNAYEFGRGVKKSWRKARKWYGKAAAQGDPLAKAMLER